MTFKDQVASDRNSLLSLQEFAETHTYDGITITAVVDRDLARERVAKRLNERTEGVWVDALILFVKAEDLPKKPFVDGKFIWDGKRVFYITDVQLQGGIYCIEAGSNEA